MISLNTRSNLTCEIGFPQNDDRHRNDRPAQHSEEQSRRPDECPQNASKAAIARIAVAPCPPENGLDPREDQRVSEDVGKEAVAEDAFDEWFKQDG